VGSYSIDRKSADRSSDFVKQVAESSDSSSASSSGDKKNALQILTHLRKLCDHPSLVLEPGSQEVRRLSKQLQSDYNAQSLLDYCLSGKMVALRQLLNQCGIGADDTVDDKVALCLPNFLLIKHYDCLVPTV